MDLLTIVLALLSVMGALVVKMIAAELQDWLPTLAHRIVDRAAERLRGSEYERYREEWHAHLNEYPGKLAKLWHAIGCSRASHALARKIQIRQTRNQTSSAAAPAFEIMTRKIPEPPDLGPQRPLTLREREVLQWIAAGKSSWDVSCILGISERTVNWLISRAARKLNAVNRTDAIVKAIRAGEIYI